jgi:hypothetical protein
MPALKVFQTMLSQKSGSRIEIDEEQKPATDAKNHAQ